MIKLDSVSAAAHSLARCHSCGRVEPIESLHCPRCHAPLHLRKQDSLKRTMALTIGAAVLYIPANLLPVLRVESTLNGIQQNTIISGVIQFWQEGDYPVALINFYRQRCDPSSQNSRHFNALPRRLVWPVATRADPGLPRYGIRRPVVNGGRLRRSHSGLRRPAGLGDGD